MNLSQLLAKANVRLNKIDPRIAERMRNVITIAHSMGIYVIITQGLRTIAEQNALYAQGRTKPGKIVTNAKGGQSYHNFGLAVDFAIVNSTGTTVYWDTNVDTNKDGQKDWYQVGKIGKEQGLEWGGDWTSFKDIPHFQYTFGLSLAQLREGRRPSSQAVIPGGKVVHDPNSLSYGNTGAKVKDLQEKLNFIGIDVGAVDSSYGNAVVAGVKLFQSRKNLPVTGIADKATIDMINALYTERKGEVTTATPKPENKPNQDKGEVRMYKPSNTEFINATATVLRRLESEQHGDKAISSIHREKLLKGELPLDDALALIYVAFARGLIQGEGKKSE